MKISILFLALSVTAFGQVDRKETEMITAFHGSSSQGKKGAKLADDRTFYRRIWLDLTGRIPSPEQTQAFSADSDPDKRVKIIDTLMRKTTFVDRWTTFYEDLLRTRLIIENGMYRNPFHDLIRDAVSRNLPWDELARSIITSSGKGVAAKNGFLYYVYELADEDFRLDFLDDQTSFITETMLGLNTSCISCHDGAYHLEDINKGLATMTRRQFWGMASMLAGTYLYIEAFPEDEDDDLAYLQSLALIDLDKPGFLAGEESYLFEEDERYATGEYRADSRAGDGMRPPRNGGIIAPAYLTTGEQPRLGETRREALARMLTADRQFARSMVNRVWGHFFGEGFVEPLESWDLGRIDPATADANGATVQARDYQLMEYLTDQFIADGYDLRKLIKLIVRSELYQWDYSAASVNSGNTTGLLSFWRSQQRTRRLPAEAIIDGVKDVLGFPARYAVSGIYTHTFDSVWQMPGTNEPNIGALFAFNSESFAVYPTQLGYESVDEYYFYQYSTMELLSELGRGDFANGIGRKSNSDINTALSLMNGESHNYWLQYARYSPLIQDWRDRLEDERMTRAQVVEAMYQRVLFREPNGGEAQQFSDYFTGKETSVAIADMLWVLFNHPDFLYKR